MKKSTRQDNSQDDPFATLPVSPARPRRSPVRFVAGEKLRELRLIQRLTPQDCALQRPLEDRCLEAFVLWARRQGLSLNQVRQGAKEEFTDLVRVLRERYENGDRSILGQIVAAERPGEPWLIEEPWYKSAILKELFAPKPLPILGSGRTAKRSQGDARYAKRQSTKASKQRYDARVRREVSRLEPAVIAERAKRKPPTVLTHALDSPNAATRKAARLVQDRLKKGRL